jgi:hypothetical protein
MPHDKITSRLSMIPQGIWENSVVRAYNDIVRMLVVRPASEAGFPSLAVSVEGLSVH